jgi:protocatechuate 3,4-dioxygenase beta subunit
VHLVVSVFLALFINQAAAPTTGGITGRIVADGTNAPIADARVLVFPAGRPTGPMGLPPQAITDQDGRFAFGKLAPGEYRLDVQKTGFAPLNEPMTQPRTFTVAAGQPLSVDLRLQRGGVISGRVLDARGEPMTDANVIAMRRMPAPPNGVRQPRLLPAPMRGPQQTNDLGEFRIAGLAPGEYVIAATRHGFLPALGGPGVPPPRSSASGAHTTMVTTFYPGTADQAGAQVVTVAAGTEAGNIVFTMQSAPAFRVSGIVVDESGTPIENAMVMLMSDPRSGPMMGPIGSGRSDASGRFAIEEVPTGSYRANASVMMSVSGTGSGGIGAVSTGYTSFSSGPIGGIAQSAEIIVADADVKGVRVVTRRPTPR